MLYSLQCCAIREISGIENYTPKETVKQVAKEYCCSDEKSAFLLFTFYANRKKGDNLKKFIEKNKLGTVTKSRAKKNPNSGNNINIFIWSIGRINFKKWALKNLKNCDNSYCKIH